jgi:hypothetical protein
MVCLKLEKRKICLSHHFLCILSKNGGEAEDNCCRKNLKGKGDLKRLLIRFS